MDADPDLPGSCCRLDRIGDEREHLGAAILGELDSAHTSANHLDRGGIPSASLAEAHDLGRLPPVK
jgi:hypothetical protein